MVTRVALLLVLTASIANAEQLTDSQVDAIYAQREAVQTRRSSWERHDVAVDDARKRAAGAAILAIGAIMIPISAAWYGESVFGGGCIAIDGPCPSNSDDRAQASTPLFIPWHLVSHGMVIAGGVLLGQGRSARVDSPTSRHALGLRIAGGLLVAAAGVMVPLGIVQLHNDLGGRSSDAQAHDAGAAIIAVGSLAAIAGVPITGASAYYAPETGPRLGVAPIARAGQDGRTSVDGATVTLSGRF